MLQGKSSWLQWFYCPLLHNRDYGDDDVDVDGDDGDDDDVDANIDDLYPLDDDLYLPPCVERIQPSKEGGPAWRTHLEMCVFGFLDLYLDLMVNDQ